jgi:MFS family permease
MVIASVMINEMIDSKYSGMIMSITNSLFPLSGLINVFFIYYFKNWLYFHYFTVTIAVANNILGFIYLVESPRWLIANNKMAEFEDSVLFIAKINGRLHETIDEFNSFYERKNTITESSFRKHNYKYFDLIKYPSVRWLSLKHSYLWIASGFSFFSLLLNLKGMTGNIYTDACITYTAEFIAEIYSGYISQFMGRKNVIMYAFLLSMIGSFGFSFVKIFYIDYVFLFLASIGIASAFNVLYIYSTESYPTNIKGLTIGILSLLNRLAASIVPSILVITSQVIPIVGILSFVAYFIMLTMEESLYHDPGDELEEFKNKIFEENLNNTEDSDYIYRIFELSF